MGIDEQTIGLSELAGLLLLLTGCWLGDRFFTATYRGGELPGTGRTE